MTKPRRSTIPIRNLSPFGWWIATYLERFEWHGSNAKSHLVWENTILIKATNRDLAFRKAEKFGRMGRGKWRLYGRPPGRKGRWAFVGIVDLLPIYGELADGEELLWEEHLRMTTATASKLVKRKSQLAVFDDTSVA
jgi:hypothetical protein